MKSRYFYSFFQKIFEHLLRIPKEQGKILMFHQINDNMDNWDDENVSITLKAFNVMLLALIKKGYSFCHISDLRKEELSSKEIFITFDDGYREIYETIYPLLRKYDIPFTVFVTTEFLGKEKYLTKDMLIELSKDPLCTIGAHTINHPMLRWISKEKVRYEIEYSKDILNQLLKSEIKYFAYPYGSFYTCSLFCIYAVKRAGYTIGFSTVNTPLNKWSKNMKYFIPRININEENYTSLL